MLTSPKQAEGKTSMIVNKGVPAECPHTVPTGKCKAVPARISQRKDPDTCMAPLQMQAKPGMLTQVTDYLSAAASGTPPLPTHTHTDTERTSTLPLQIVFLKLQ